jgi:CRISPR-associated protein Csm2
MSSNSGANETIDGYICTLNDLKVRALKVKYSIVKTNQLRNILSAVNRISNLIDIDKGDETLKSVRGELNSLKVQIIYQSGRTDLVKVKEFENAAKIIRKLSFVINSDSKAKYRLFAKYIEALVAYHKYYGGDN